MSSKMVRVSLISSMILGVLATSCDPSELSVHAGFSKGAAPSSTTSFSAPSGSAPSASPSEFDADVAPQEGKVLLREFSRAQVTQVKALEHRNQFELKEFKVSQDFKFKEWKSREQEARHRFFSEHLNGTERRVYIQSYVQRRDALLNDLSSEKSKKAQELDFKINELKDVQGKKLQEVKKLLEKGKRPDPSLWPESGR